MTELNLKSLIELGIKAFLPENAAGIDAKIQAHITGSQGGDWVATIRDQTLKVEEDTVATPNLYISADTQDVFDLVSGKLNPMQAYMQGKVEIKGDINLAMRLVSLFKRF